MIDMATIAPTPGAVIIPGRSGTVCKRCGRLVTTQQAYYQACHLGVITIGLVAAKRGAA